MQGSARILHFDADNFFAACEQILSPALRGRALVVAGGRRQNGIVLSASRRAKEFGIKSGMACFRARQLCAELVVCPARPEVYRQISARMFAALDRYSPLVVPLSVDEGFLSVERNGAELWRALSETILREIGLPLSGGLANSRWLAKLATDAAKPGFLEVPQGAEKDFLALRNVRELSGIGEQNARALAALGAVTFGDVARLPSMLLRQRFSIFGQKLFLFASGEWREKLCAEARTRSMISRNKTFSFDVRDYERVRQFGLVELRKLLAQLRRERLAPRELGVTVRFADFSEVSARHRFRVAQEREEIICEIFSAKFAECVGGQSKFVRQLRFSLSGLVPVQAQGVLFV